MIQLAIVILEIAALINCNTFLPNHRRGSLTQELYLLTLLTFSLIFCPSLINRSISNLFHLIRCATYIRLRSLLVGTTPCFSTICSMFFFYSIQEMRSILLTRYIFSTNSGRRREDWEHRVAQIPPDEEVSHVNKRLHHLLYFC